MTRDAVLAFMRRHPYAVQASVSAVGAPQAAVVGVIVTAAFEVVFDTLHSTRKAVNLRTNPTVALVFGGTANREERTVQYEGVADEPVGEELERLLALYFASFPGGRARRSWAGITYLRVRPTWIRYSDFAGAPAEIEEFDAARIAGGG